MPLIAGTRCGPYEILAPIGAGGMGEVYRARDTKLKRDVAVKVLPEAFARDPGRMMRFQREAEVLASLNHPNIAHIYGVEERALVMELVEGESPKGPLPFDDAWRIALQIVDALEYAHEKGVIHRDLKPANVRVTPDGVVKLLDFGLAKAFSETPDASSSDPENSPTITLGATVAGTVLGTAAYMSPEQAKGKKVDKRADIWSWGVVLYELLTGERLFKGGDATDTLAQVLTKEPPLERVPPQVRRLLGECLQKDPRLRLRDIGDARRVLEKAAPLTARSRSWRGIVLAAAVLIAIALGFGWWHATQPPEHPIVTKLSILPPEGVTFDYELPAISPDGRHVAFQAFTSGQTQLWVRDLDSLTSRPLPGTEGAVRPFWSADSRNIGFFAGGKLKRTASVGGPVLSLADSPHTYFGAWNQDDVILYTPSNAIFRVSASGGTPTQVTDFDPNKEGFHAVDGFLPDGRHFLYTYLRGDGTSPGTTFIGDINSKQSQLILSASPFVPVVYAPPGYLLFANAFTLMAQPFDAEKGQVTGEALPFVEGVDQPSNAPARFSVSQNGVLVYYPTGAFRQLTWFDRSGRPRGTIGPQAIIPKGAISPDGKTVAFENRTQPPITIWLHDLEHGTETVFERNAQRPVWSGDGAYIAFWKRDGQVYRKPVNGTGQEEPLGPKAAVRFLSDWSSDGRYLIEETRPDAKTGRDIWVVPLFGDKTPYPLLHSEADEFGAALTPNGRWLAYVSNESKRNEIYVVSFPNSGKPMEISTGGGDRPVWSRDGEELYFIGPGQKMMAVEIQSSPTFDYSVPKPLFDAKVGGALFDVARNGRFLISAGAARGAAAMHVTINWPTELKK